MDSIPNNSFSNYIILPLNQLVKADWNYKTDDRDLLEKLKANIKRNGQIENIIVRKLPSGFYEIVNGNHRYDALVELNFVEVMVYNFGEISLAQAQRIAIETNETRFASDIEKLSKLLDEIKLEFDDVDLLTSMPFSEEQLNNLMESMTDLNETPSSNIHQEITEDNFDVETPNEGKTKPGDLYELISVKPSGTLTHRLLNGDSTKSEDVTRLMNGEKAHMVHTDPPYNVKYTELNSKRNDSAKDWTESYCAEWNDDMSDSDYKSFVYNFIKNFKDNMIEWGHFYIWHATTYYREFLEVLEQLEMPYDKVPIQWVKQVAPLHWVRYKRITEPCIFGGKGAVNGNGPGARWFGPNNENNAWKIDREHTAYYVHPTQKPIALASRAIQNSSQAGEIVLDLFMGSGTTLIASDILGRNAYGMELGSLYSDVIVLRFAKHKLDNNEEFTILRNGKDITKEVTESLSKLEKKTVTGLTLPDSIENV